MDNVIKMVELLEKSGLLIDGASESVKHEKKKKKKKKKTQQDSKRQEGGFLPLLALLLMMKVLGKEVRKTGRGIYLKTL